MRRLIFFALVLACGALVSGAARAATVTFTIDPGGAATPIPPLTYGTNQDVGVPEIPLYRQGGNRLTGYNWENNASSAGMDWYNSSDWYMLGAVGLPGDGNQQPATVITKFHNDNKARNDESLVTLPMAGYVAADGSFGSISVTAPNPTYWKETVFEKGSAYTLTPNKTDDFVYVDEQMNFLLSTLGNAAAGGIKYYCLDNEPAIWNGTHPLIHPDLVTYEELRDRSVNLATVITGMDPGAQTFGPVEYGWYGFDSLNGTAGSDVYNATYGWFLNYYLDQMQSASLNAGRRLLHWLDVHWYSEAQGGGVRITGSDGTVNNADNNTQAVAIARMQAPRSLWDPTYIENSWITSSLGNQPITLLPRLKAGIDQYYPGTRISVSEFNHGGGADVSGGIAQADTLGWFGRYGAAGCWWQMESDVSYIRAAYRMYLNYDGAGARFGDLSIPSQSSSATLTSVHASRSDSDPAKVWVVALNRDYSNPVTGVFNLSLTGGRQIASMRVFRFDSTTSNLVSVAAPSFSTASFNDLLPFRSATIYEVTLNQAFLTATPTASGTPTATGTPTGTPTPTATGTPLTATPTRTVTLTRTPTRTPTRTLTRTITPTLPPGCAVLFNGCENPAENGTWGGGNSTRTFSTSNVTQGTSSLRVSIAAAVDWNDDILSLSGFSPNVWTGVTQLVLDVTADATLLTGANYNQLALMADSATQNYENITADYPSLVAGANSVTFDIEFSLGAILATDALTTLRIIFNKDSTTGSGSFYFDNIRLVRSPCPYTPTNTPTWGNTSTPTRTVTASLTRTVTSSRTATSSPTASPTRTQTPTHSSTWTRSSTLTATLSASPTDTATASHTWTPSPTSTMSSTGSPSYTASRTATSSPSATQTSSPTSSPSASPTGTWLGFTPTETGSPTDTVTRSPTVTPTSTHTSTPTPTRTHTPPSSSTATVTATLTPSVTLTRTFSMTSTPSSTSTVTATLSHSSTWTRTPSATASSTETSSPTSSSSAAASPTATRTSTISPTETRSATHTFTDSMTPSPTPSATPSFTAPLTASGTPTALWTLTQTPSLTATPSATQTSTPSPSATSVNPGTPTDTGTPSTAVTASPTPEVIGDAVLYPNPVTGGTAVTLRLELTSRVSELKIKVFTPANRVILDMLGRDLTAGENHLSLDLRDREGVMLANGLYYLVVSMDGRKKILKLLVLR